MPTITKGEQLPSKSIRIRKVVGHKIVKGKRVPIQKSFTGASKDDAEYAALKYIRENVRVDKTGLTVLESIKLCIDSKQNVISPSTHRGYLVCCRNYYDDIGDIKLRDLKKQDIQSWVNSLSLQYSTKTIKNAYGLLRTTLDFYDLPTKIKVRFPEDDELEYYVPSSEEVSRLLSESEGDLHIAILLAATASLREGEISALEEADIDRKKGTIRVTKSRVEHHDGTISTKTPKTKRSRRTVMVSKKYLKLIPKSDGRIIKTEPHNISTYFGRLIRKTGMDHRITFHSLRHYFASELAAQNIPLSTIEKMGGWSPGSPVLRKVYIGFIEKDLHKKMNIAVQHFGEVLKISD